MNEENSKERVNECCVRLGLKQIGVYKKLIGHL